MGRVLAILGAGGHGRVVADCAEAAGWDRFVFFDDNPHVALDAARSVVRLTDVRAGNEIDGE